MIFVMKSSGCLKPGTERELVNIDKAESIRVDEYKEKSETSYRISAYFGGLSWERLADKMTKEKAMSVLDALMNSIVEDSAGYEGHPKSLIIRMDDLISKE